ncbi:MAG: glycosyl hydrolase family 79 C-terminal domain-containing protein [Solirubrobacteraceae bacterium]
MRFRLLPGIVVVLGAAGAVAVVLALVLGSAGARADATNISRAAVGRPVPPGFVGLSIKLGSLEQYAGADPSAPDPVFVRLLSQLAPRQHPVLRLGGDGTDWSWWPVAHMARPAGIRYTLTPQWMRVTRSLADALGARLILGVNMEAGSVRLASAEARAMVSGIGRGSIAALELGNEPELYGAYGWYQLHGRPVLGRPRNYDLADFIHDFSAVVPRLPDVPLAGPASGAASWLSGLGLFLHYEPRVRIATVHAYPLKRCRHTTVVRIAQLLSDSSSHGLALSLESYVATAAAHGIPLRVDEMNGISCGGTPGVSDSFASALWVLDTLFELARTGVHGVNIGSVPGRINEVLGPDHAGGTWRMRVHPEYYGMLMFAQAAPPGSRLLRVEEPLPPGIKLWATRSPGGRIHVVVINKRLRDAQSLSLRIAGARGPATVEQLRAPRAGATRGVTLGGRSFGAETSTGELAGRLDAPTIDPSDGVYGVRVPAASAKMLTLADG